jgi:hypothetical protein
MTPILIPVLVVLGLRRTFRAMLGVMTTTALTGFPVRVANAVVTGQLALIGAALLLRDARQERCGDEREQDHEDTHRTLLAFLGG